MCNVGIGEFEAKEHKEKEFAQWVNPTRKLQTTLKEEKKKRTSYKASKKKILDIVRTELRIACITPIARSKELPNQKPQKLCREIHGIDGNGDRILSISKCWVIRFQSETVAIVKNGMWIISDGDWPVDLGSLLFYI